MVKYLERLNAEWQNMGLPHNHILVWLTNKIHASQIDSFLSVEIPNKLIDPELYEIISNQMIQGPYGRMKHELSVHEEWQMYKTFPKRIFVGNSNRRRWISQMQKKENRKRRTTLYHEEKNIQ